MAWTLHPPPPPPVAIKKITFFFSYPKKVTDIIECGIFAKGYVLAQNKKKHKAKEMWLRNECLLSVQIQAAKTGLFLQFIGEAALLDQ